MKKIIDVSEHNSVIDFNKVKNDGIDGVIIRVGWIGNKNNHTIDKYFEENYKKALANGLKIGFYVYSYCNSTITLKSGINWLIDKIKNKTFELPVFLDLEDSTIANLTKYNLTLQALMFCELIQKNKWKAGVYASKFWWLNKLDINKLLDYKIWLAEWNGKQNHTLNYKVDLWQYTSKGKVNGINSNVDMNYCMCECEKFDKQVETVDNRVENSETIKETGVFEVAKTYKNGSTIENVYADSNLSKKIGTLNKYETCECLGTVNGRYIVKYKVDKSNNYKVGFVKYSGGVK